MTQELSVEAELELFGAQDHYERERPVFFVLEDCVHRGSASRASGSGHVDRSQPTARVLAAHAARIVVGGVGG
jgi:hypothetical protein